ncbi:MAG: sulfite exporter TauE/SafE family protein [Eubacteriales bacterium]
MQGEASEISKTPLFTHKSPHFSHTKREWGDFVYFLFGALAGGLNGLFGGGGGAILVPLLLSIGHLEERKAFATSVGVMLPISAISAVIYFLNGSVSVGEALPYVLGGAIGGILGGKWFSKANPVWLRRGFAILLIVSGVRSFL